MRLHPTRRRLAAIGSALTVWGFSVMAAAPARAQEAATPPRNEPPANAEFLLGRPRIAIAVKGGWLFAATGSDIYDFVTTRLTLSKSSFNTPVIGGELSVALGDRVDVVAGLDGARSKTASEYRDFVDNRQQPIEQSTTRQEYGVSATARLALVPRGRRISRFAWIPRTLAPYVGAGAGAVKYRFEQAGSFVDAVTLKVFDDDFQSAGWAPSVHALAGADLRVFRRMYLTFEGRYTWSKATLSEDFVGFAPISLAGFRVSSGLQVVF
jgi:opacity protein-like surface antigen